VRDILSTLERWSDDGVRAAVATVVATQRSVTGGCVEPAVYEEAREVLAGGEPRLKTYGIADEEAFEVGLACGGTVHIFVWPLPTELLRDVAGAVREERPVALLLPLAGGEPRLYERDAVPADELERRAQELLARGATAIVESDDGDVFVDSYAPRPNMYVFGAVDHAAALAEVGRFLGYRVTVCDARSRFVTPNGRTGSSSAPRWTSARRSASSRTTTSSTCRC
jgi:xanthine dehydrogenase accessory factor